MSLCLYDRLLLKNLLNLYLSIIIYNSFRIYLIKNSCPTNQFSNSNYRSDKTYLSNDVYINSAILDYE